MPRLKALPLAALLLLTAACGGAAETTPSAPAVGPTGIPPPPATPSQPGPTTLIFRGSGDQATAPFNVSGSALVVDWEALDRCAYTGRLQDPTQSAGVPPPFPTPLFSGDVGNGVFFSTHGPGPDSGEAELMAVTLRRVQIVMTTTPQSPGDACSAPRPRRPPRTRTGRNDSGGCGNGWRASGPPWPAG